MADKSNAAARQHLRVETSPLQIPKELIVTENPIPLSPQWLLPKPGENRSGITAVESHFNPSHGNRPDIGKAPGNNDEILDAEKRSAISRPSFHDAEGVRQNRWRDEERETNSAVRRDRWRDGDGDKDLYEARRERRTENSSRVPTEVRRASSDRWNEMPNRDSSFDHRRESKWNSRWGPDDKDSDGWREKKIDSVREVEATRDSGTPLQLHPGKEEKDGENPSRPWRPSSYARGRGDPTFGLNKPGQSFGSWRGRGENGSSTFSAGRGKLNPVMGSTSASSANVLGTILDVPSGDYGDSIRYSRMRLLDIYRMMDIKNYKKPLDGFVEVPSLSQMELLEPLAMSTPSPDELAILKSIDSGDTVSSGIPWSSKDAVSHRPGRAGNGEDLSSSVDDSRNGILDKLKSDQHILLDPVSRKMIHLYGLDQEDLGSHSFQDEKDIDPREANVRELEGSSRHGRIPSRTESTGEIDQRLSKNLRDFSGTSRSRASEPNALRLPKDQEPIKLSNDPTSSPFNSNKIHLPSAETSHPDIRGDIRFRRQSSGLLDPEREATKAFPHLQPSPEELVLCYKDPQGQVQGPFSGADLIGWFEAGYFGLDLLVRPFNAPIDYPFSSLGDVMPHLQMKAKPPPGFTLHKQTENVDALAGPMLIPQGSIRAGLGSIEFNSGQRMQYESKGSLEAENRFLESLMSSNSTIQGEPGKGLNYLLAQRLSVEQQQAFPTSSGVSHVDLPQGAGYLHDRLSLSNPTNIGMDLIRDRPDPHHSNQQLPSPSGYGIPSQRLQPPGQLSLSHLVSQPGIPQDPNFVNMLQQQYMLSQLQLQSHIPVPGQLSILDKLILMEHQKQEQQLLLQQQHLLSQILSEQQSQQQQQAVVGSNPTLPGQMGLPQLLETLRMSSHSGALSVQDGNGQSASNLPVHALQGLGGPVGSTLAVDHSIQSKEWPVVPEEISNPRNSDSLLPMPSMALEKSFDAVDLNVNSRDLDHNTDPLISTEAKCEERDPCEDTFFQQHSDDMKSNSDDISEPPQQSVSPNMIKPVEASPAKKASDKKSKKQKNSKVQVTAATTKGPSKTATLSQPLKQDAEIDSEMQASPLISSDENLRVESPNFQGHVESSDNWDGLNEEEYADQANMHLPAQRAWKPAPVPKAKSLLEIQQEEQRRAKIEVPVPDLVAIPIPARWSGIVSNSIEPKVGSDVIKSGTNAQRKSQLHDLLAEEVISTPVDAPSFPETKTKSEISVVNEDDFVEAKDSKKNRKKAAKAKVSGAKNTGPIVSPEVTPIAPTGKTKVSSQVQQEREKEVSSVLPSGPSLGDFVFWKGDQVGSADVPAPAWSTDSLRAQKPASLRQILKEEEKKTSLAPKQIPTASSPKAQQLKNIHGVNSPWLVSGTSPSSKTVSPGAGRSLTALTKSKTEDELFWGPLDHQPKQDKKLPNIPSPAPPSIWGGKSSPATLGRTDYSLSFPVVSQPPSKGRRDTFSKNSEAMDFRNWCEGELLRLTGTRDTDFLEFCMKQTSMEARTLLRENLGSLDRDHAFIDKLLNYKELLPAEVVELAFQLPAGRASAVPVPMAVTSLDDGDGNAGIDPDGSGKGGGRKKGKKGKKVSAAVLGFNVVSNRIMMGEIQNVED